MINAATRPLHKRYLAMLEASASTAGQGAFNGHCAAMSWKHVPFLQTQRASHGFADHDTITPTLCFGSQRYPTLFALSLVSSTDLVRNCFHLVQHRCLRALGLRHQRLDMVPVFRHRGVPRVVVVTSHSGTFPSAQSTWHAARLYHISLEPRTNGTSRRPTSGSSCRF